MRLLRLLPVASLAACAANPSALSIVDARPPAFSSSFIAE